MAARKRRNEAKAAEVAENKLMAIADGVENDENIEELAIDYEW